MGATSKGRRVKEGERGVGLLITGGTEAEKGQEGATYKATEGRGSGPGPLLRVTEGRRGGTEGRRGGTEREERWDGKGGEGQIQGE